jgi:subtilisin family serine protease
MADFSTGGRRLGLAAAVAAVALLVGGQPFDGESSLATAPAAATADLPAENVIVRFEPGTPARERAEARDDADVRVEETLPLPNTQLVTPEAGVSPDEAAEQLERSPAVRYAEPDAPRRAFAVVPNDRFFRQQWGLNNTGQSVGGTTGTVDADIDAPEAWQLTTGSAAVTVAVIDSGVELDHPDLAAGIWRNPGESGDRREYNGADDDGNGLVDDWRGWDWVDDDNDPTDANGHGTHVAGTVGARGNDGSGVTGVAWDVSLMPLRTLGANGSGYVSDVIRAYGYAGARKAHIVNASLGGSAFSRAERDAIAAAPQTLFVVAAGNDSADNDAQPSYPCNHALANVVCVAATDQRDGLADFSNYGATTVDLAAPGDNIASTYTGGSWALLSGTSMATPHVAGAAALLWARVPAASVAQVRGALLSSVVPRPALLGRTVTGGVLNADRALRTIDPNAATAQEAPITPAPAPAPSLSPGAAPDTAAPVLRLSLSRRQALATALSRGVLARARCSEACTLRTRLFASRNAVIGSARTGALAGRGKNIRTRPSRRARTRLRRSRTITLRLEIRAIDAARNSRVVTRRVSLQR